MTIAVTPSNARRDLKLSDAIIHLSGATFVRDDGVRVVETVPIILTGPSGGSRADAVAEATAGLCIGTSFPEIGSPASHSRLLHTTELEGSITFL